MLNLELESPTNKNIRQNPQTLGIKNEFYFRLYSNGITNKEILEHSMSINSTI